jgi:hypothetical protein
MSDIDDNVPLPEEEEPEKSTSTLETIKEFIFENKEIIFALLAMLAAYYYYIQCNGEIPFLSEKSD